MTAVPDAEHPILSVKDPSAVFFEGQWHVFATVADQNAQWSLVYLNFDDWASAGDAEFQFLDQNPALVGYHAAPHVFYFEPEGKWFLIFQSQQPQYSTSDDITDPLSWSAPQNFFDAEPAIVTENAGDGTWLDYFVICDDAKCHLFFTDDNGHLYRSDTAIGDFPSNFGDPVIAIDGTKSTLFEGSAHYRVGETGQYLTLVEAFGDVGERYYRSFVSDSLDGDWTPFAATLDNPFAARGSVAFEGGDAWTLDISHGEMIRDGFDQSMTIDPANLQFLYQGVNPEEAGVDYYALPYQLALLTYTDTPTAPMDAVIDGPSACASATSQAAADVANFDDGTNAGFWDSYDDSAGAMHSALTAEAPGANGTSHAIHFSGTGYDDWGANFGVTPGCTDTSAFDGLSLYAKGTSSSGSLGVIAQVAAALPASAGGDCAADCYSHPRTAITLSEEWQRYDIPFGQFLYPGWGVRADYEGIVMGFAFESVGDFDIWVDELVLYTGDGPDDSAAAGGDAGTPAMRTDAGMLVADGSVPAEPERNSDAGASISDAEAGSVVEDASSDSGAE